MEDSLTDQRSPFCVLKFVGENFLLVHISVWYAFNPNYPFVILELFFADFQSIRGDLDELLLEVVGGELHGATHVKS